MFFELIHEVFNEVSPFYIYISLCLTMFSFEGFQFTLKNKMNKNHLYIRHCHEVQFHLLPKLEDTPAMTEIRNWITTKTKRMDAPDDDTDGHAFSLRLEKKIRGGFIWKHLYSHSLGNIVLFSLSFSLLFWQVAAEQL